MSKVVDLRHVIVRNSYKDDEVIERWGEQIYSVNEKGVLISAGGTLTLYPWSRVLELEYSIKDEPIRKYVQGY